jgi:FtsH-binding integral membrane protein
MLRQNLLFGFGFLEGLAIAPMLALASPATITLALAGTGAIFAGFSLAALRAKSRTFLALGGPLMGGVLLLVRASI